MLDADDFLGFTERLRTVRERIEAAAVSREQKGRWQRKLLAITDAAQRDLDDATDLLRRFEAELDRRL